MNEPSPTPMYGYDFDAYVDMTLGVTEAMSQASAPYDLLMEQLDQQRDTRAAKLPESRTEAERPLAAVWDYEARSPRTSSLPKLAVRSHSVGYGPQRL